MTDFHKFAKAVNKNFESMAKGQLFKVENTNDILWKTYINSFPEGSDPIYITETAHTCSCCKNFIRNVANVVSFDKDGNRVTVWDIEEKLPHTYNQVADTMRKLVLELPIVSTFWSSEKKYGNESNIQLLEGNNTKKWFHFWANVPKTMVVNDAGKRIGHDQTTFQVFHRGMKEISEESLTQILDLIDDNNLYRGLEHRATVKCFLELKKEYDKNQTRDFCWFNMKSPYARTRNTVIGTLAQDLSDGMDIEEAVKRFETKVAPENYKRSKSLITPKMVKSAVETLKTLGLEHSVERRHARLSDVSVNSVLFVDNEVAGKMKDGLTDLLMPETQVKKGKKNTKIEPISAEKFFEEVLPGTKEVKLIVENDQLGNFVSMTAPKEEGTGRLFKWDNDFAWSYSGGVADSLKERVSELGGRVDGALRFTHSWNSDGRNQSLMDLHCFMPKANGEASVTTKPTIGDRYPTSRRVGWNNRNDPKSGGVQDVDYTQEPGNNVPVENITFPSKSRMPDGEYVFKIHNWRARGPNYSGFQAEIEFDGQLYQYNHPSPLTDKQWIPLAVVTKKRNSFSIKHLHELSSTKPVEKWGVKTLQPVKVQNILVSPNHWDDNSVGNKHWFFILDGCKNPDPVRGIYNEFLRGDLNDHRKVFEVLADKTKCKPEEEQLSGFGMSSTKKGEKVKVIADGRPYEIVI